ncbi:hypothetical protein OAB00_01235 [Akkermansiaceae bacterium]|nr:hypothetical protein [Akkermansiaceae bacterium]
MKLAKVIGTLPTTLERNTLYAVRVGAGFDLYLTDDNAVVISRALNPLSPIWDATNSSYFKNDDFIYRAWARNDGDYYAVKFNRSTGLKVGEFTGTLPIPTDLTVLTYS